MTLLTMPDEPSRIDGTLGFRVSNEARLKLRLLHHFALIRKYHDGFYGCE